MNDPHFRFDKYPKHLDSSNGYDEKTALFLAVMCHLAYQPAKRVESVIRKKSGKAEFICHSKGLDIDTQCFVAEFDDAVLIAFRGSWQWQDWLTSIQFPQVRGPIGDSQGQGMVHKGMWDALKPVVDSILNQLALVDLENKPLWITGHSLGGGLANLFAGILFNRGIDIEGIYTFACPRITDDYHADKVESHVSGPYFRLENRFDPVPDLPPRRLVNYRHSGELVDVYERTNYFYKNWRWFWKTITRVEKGFRKSFRIPNPYHRHNLASGRNSYIPRLERRLKAQQM